MKPENLADKVILVGDPGRVALVASHFENIECEASNREFRAITGTFRGKRITVLSTGIGCDNIDIVVNELDALANIDFKTRTEKETFTPVDIRAHRLLVGGPASLIHLLEHTLHLPRVLVLTAC